MQKPLIYFPEGCVIGRFVKRYKRFFIEAIVNGKAILAHTNNTGSMLGLLQPGTPILLSPATNPSRKLNWTVELIWTGGKYPEEAKLPSYPNKIGGVTPFHSNLGFWVGVNTLIPHKFFKLAFEAGLFSWTKGYSICEAEKKTGISRLDICLQGEGLPRLWVECKNVTLVEDNIALFPDAISKRGLKHIEELESIIDAGERAATFYCVQRQDGQSFGPAYSIDPDYAKAFWNAQKKGVEIYPYRIDITTIGLSLGNLLPVLLKDN